MFIERLTREDINKFIDLINKECPEITLICVEITKNKKSLTVNLQNYYEYSGDVTENFNIKLTDFNVIDKNMKPEFKAKFKKVWVNFLYSKYEDEYLYEIITKLDKKEPKTLEK